MKKVTATGQSVEEAVNLALAQLNSTKDRVEIEIEEEGKKDFSAYLGQGRPLSM